jgi:hypothetical protein
MYPPSPMRFWVLFSYYFATVASNECSYFFHEDTTFCNNFGVCEGHPETSCDDAYNGITQSLLRPSSSLLYQPEIGHDMSLFGVRLRSHKPESEVAVKRMVRSLKELMKYLDEFHSPRVIFQNLTFSGPTMRSIVVDVLGIDAEDRSTITTFYATPELRRFGTFVVAFTTEILRIQNTQLRTNCLFNMIPFLHLWSFLQVEFALPSFHNERFWDQNYDLLLTITQFEPIYVSEENLQAPLWRFALLDPYNPELLDNKWERPLVPILCDRFTVMEGMAEELLRGASNTPTLPRLIFTLSYIVRQAPQRVRSDMATYSAYFENLLYLVDQAGSESPGLVSLQQFCTDHPGFVADAGTRISNRGMAMLVYICKSQLPFTARVAFLSSFTNTEQNNSGFHSTELWPSSDEVVEATDYILAVPRVSFRLNLFVLPTSWVDNFLEYALVPHIRPGMNLDVEFASDPKNKRILIAIGRMLAQSLWFGDRSYILKRAMQHVDWRQPHTFDEILFFNSYYIKIGFYDLFPYSSFEDCLNPAEIPHLIEHFASTNPRVSLLPF